MGYLLNLQHNTIKSVKKFLLSQFVAWSGAPRTHHYFQFCPHPHPSPSTPSPRNTVQMIKRSPSCLDILPLFSCDSSSIHDNVRRSVCRSLVCLSVCWSVTNEFQSQLYSFRITLQCIECIKCKEYNA